MKKMLIVQIIATLMLLPALLGPTLGSPLPQEKAAATLGDDPDYFGGIYIGDGSREDVEKAKADDEEYGEYFGGIYVGNGDSSRSDPGPVSPPVRTSAEQNQPDIFGGIGSILQGLFGLVSGAVEGVAKVAGDPVSGKQS